MGPEGGHVEQLQNGVNLFLVLRSEHSVNVLDDGLDVRGAVFGHVVEDGLEVSPVVAVL